MNKISKNEKGFGVVEAIMALVIVVLIGAVGYLVYKDHNKPITDTNKTTSATKTETPVSKAPTIESYADCIKSKNTKTDTDAYPPTCTTAQSVVFRPTDPSNFLKVGAKINIPNNPKVTSDVKLSESGDGYCYTVNAPGSQATATLDKMSGDYALVGVSPNCGDHFVLTYGKVNGNWSVIYTSHLGLCFYPGSNPQVKNSAILQDAVSKLCD